MTETKETSVTQPYWVVVEYRSRAGNCLTRSDIVHAENPSEAMRLMKEKIEKQKNWLRFDSSKATSMKP